MTICKNSSSPIPIIKHQVLDKLEEAVKFSFESVKWKTKKKTTLATREGLKEYGLLILLGNNVKFNNDSVFVKIFFEIFDGEGPYGKKKPKNIPVYRGFVEGRRPTPWTIEEEIGTHKDIYGPFAKLVELDDGRKNMVEIGNFENIIGNPINVSEYIKKCIDGWGEDDFSGDIDDNPTITTKNESPFSVIASMITSSQLPTNKFVGFLTQQDENQCDIGKYGNSSLGSLGLCTIQNSIEKPGKSIEDVNKLVPELIRKAQIEYDNWDESLIDVYAGGGICHIIAERFQEVFWNNDIENMTVSSDFEQHVYCVILVKEGIFAIDIHHSVYETGGGFSWKKIPDVIFEPNDITFYLITQDKNEWENFLQ